MTINPSVGHIPYRATITCHAPPGQVTFELPDETIGPQDTLSLEVTIDELEWEVTARWTDGTDHYVRSAKAYGNNPPPDIRSICNGKSDLWQVGVMERTLIEADIRYDGDYRVTSFDVRGEIPAEPYTVFYPPYEAGVCHALWNGWIVEDACIVYPMYASIENDLELPYAPNGLETGYPTHWAMNTNALINSYGAAADGGLIPAQKVTITISVLDDLGRTTRKSFEIPLREMYYDKLPGDCYPPLPRI
ncbi:hypothetical protein ACFLR0_02700 [Candidatus Bipolaricaulota bacterium]